ncbi:MAG: tryptophan 7-halogenase [Elusimicrobia bacterium]|nr:tryptophan 7-halogenase [Elusimicrobiota bacterium]
MGAFDGRTYDVAIMGGGPAGATLAARLARETALSVAVFEAEFFPRDHIGESFVHSVIPVLQESGALPKVLASDCWVKKFGGYYAWSDRPWPTYFEHAAWRKDGHLRWSIHCNRPEFDQILLEHARSSGAEVFEGTPVTAVRRAGGVTRIELGDAGETSARIFVNCSGRTGSSTIVGNKPFLSQYRNIAIWNHVVGAKPPQSVPGDWNLFSEKNLSPIGCFIFEDGWFWYIPVPKIIQGRRVRTHSLGMVTDPSVLQQPGKRYTDPETFMRKAKSVRFLGELLKDAELVSDKFLTATNYSRISERMCDFDAGEIRVGDAAYFVDPLFSSGVHFALQHASAAFILIRAALDRAVPQSLARDLWEDYDAILRTVAQGFALGIDQWYHEIAKDNPGSAYWGHRGGEQTFATREETFAGLVNGSVGGDMLQIMSKGTNAIDSLGEDGSLRRTMRRLADREPPADALVRLKPEVRIKESATIEAPPVHEGKPSPFLHGPYWEDPQARAGDVRRLFPGPIPCHRFYVPEGSNRNHVKFVEERHGGLGLAERLRDGRAAYGELKASLTKPQQHLLMHLMLSDMIDVVPAAALAA